MEGYTIAEDFSLPSKGKIYNKVVNPVGKLRSMTTEEEMKRLGHSDSPFKMLSEIIDDCSLEKIGLSAYDLCESDYQYLLYKLRIVTYGSEYPVTTICPVCGAKNDQTINLDNLKINEYEEELGKYLDIDLPVAKKHLKLRVRTPRLLDWVTRKTNEFAEKTNSDKREESAFLFNIMSLIEKVDGEVIDEFKLEQFVRKLHMKDTNYILQCANKLNFGLDTSIECKCKKCKTTWTSQIPITGEFFRPTID